jgi:hypothetical protein
MGGREEGRESACERKRACEGAHGLLITQGLGEVRGCSVW